MLILFSCWVSSGESDPLPCLSFPICKVSAAPRSSERGFGEGCQIPVPKTQAGSTWGQSSLACSRGCVFGGVMEGTQVFRGLWGELRGIWGVLSETVGFSRSIGGGLLKGHGGVQGAVGILRGSGRGLWVS